MGGSGNGSTGSQNDVDMFMKLQNAKVLKDLRLNMNTK